MWKKDLEKLELDIAREKDREVAERLKPVLEAMQRERRERNLRLRRVIRIMFTVTLLVMGGFVALCSLAALVAWLAGF